MENAQKQAFNLAYCKQIVDAFRTDPVRAPLIYALIPADFVGLFFDIMSRYSELMHLLNDLVRKYGQQQDESPAVTH